MGPTVCELEGPMPMVKRSKVLIAIRSLLPGGLYTRGEGGSRHRPANGTGLYSPPPNALMAGHLTAINEMFTLGPRDPDLRRQRNGAILRRGQIPPHAGGDSEARSHVAHSVECGHPNRGFAAAAFQSTGAATRRSCRSVECAHQQPVARVLPLRERRCIRRRDC